MEDPATTWAPRALRSVLLPHSELSKLEKRTFLCSLAHNTPALYFPGAVTRVFSPGLHLVRNTRKSGGPVTWEKQVTRLRSVAGGRTLSTQRHWSVRTKGISRPKSSSFCLLDHKNHAKKTQSNTWCSRACFSGCHKSKVAVLTHKQRVAAAYRSPHTY